MKLDTRAFKPKHMNNEDVMNAIRNVSSNLYQERIPETTQANIQQNIRDIMNYTPSRNEFVDGFINQIGMRLSRFLSWSNPMAQFKIGMLEYGDTIEEYQVGLAKAYEYNDDREELEKSIFSMERPDVSVAHHKINRKNYYKISINNDQLRQAFANPTGLSTLITQLLTVPTTSDQVDEFELMMSLIPEYEKAGGFFKVHVDDIGDEDSTVSQAKRMIRSVRSMAANLQYPSRNYNAAKMMTFAPTDKLVMLITPEADAAIDVEALAAAFNIDSSSMPARKIVIPKEKFGIPGVQAILTTEDFWVVADNLLETSNALNPVALHTNYFLHHWQVISASLYVPAIMYWTGPGDDINQIETPVISVDTLTAYNRAFETVTSVERGDFYGIVGQAITLPADGFNDAVRYELTGGSSHYTYITQSGQLHVGSDEPGLLLRVKATSVDDNSFSATLDLQVTGDIVKVWPRGPIDTDGDGLKETDVPKPGFDKNTIHVPDVEGVAYYKGSTLLSGDVPITADTTVTATAKPGYEFKSGSTSSFDYTFKA